MDRRNSEDEKPSIIQEIVFYDKPNVKTLVPNEILLETKIVPPGKGDIVISRVRKPSLSKKNSLEELAASSNLTETSEEESDDPQEDVSDKNDKIVTLNNNLNDEEDARELQISEEPKQNNKTIKKNTVNVTEKAKPSSSKDTNTFKKPRGPAKKAEGKPQRLTMLNYITVESKSKGVTQLEQNVEEITVKKSKTQDNDNKEKGASKSKTKVDESPSSLKAGIKRSRGRPRKYVEVISEDELSEIYSDEDVSFRTPTKSKKYAELTNVSLQPVANDLDDLLDDVQEQVSVLDRVERELQMIVGEDGSSTINTDDKMKRKSSRKTVPNCKREVDEIDEQESESVSDVMDVSGVEDLGSEGDSSRGEWMPEEYAKYRQEHRRKQLSKTFACKFCKMEFNSYYAMRKHRALEHNDLGKDRKESVVCKEEKDQDDSDEESRDEWMPQDYADYKIKHKLNKMKRTQWYKCKICCAVFSNYYKLSKHKLEHSVIPNPYECKHCDERFTEIESLMAHIRVHQGKDPYQCKKCDKGFMKKEELEAHQAVHVMKKAPAPAKRYRCDICSKEFGKLCDIERHTRVHTGEKPCECNICHKRFQQSHNLSKHLLTHLHVKPFQCEICNKKFGRVDVLNRHLLTHSMQKPFNCAICRKGFIREVQLMSHNEKFHVKQDGKEEEEEEEEEDGVENEDGVEDEESEDVMVVA